MHRKTCKRYDVPGDAHELTFCCFHKLPLRTRALPRMYLIEAIQKARLKHSFDLWAYVIMPEHVHLLIWPTLSRYSVSAILQSIKQPVSRRVLKQLRASNPSGLQSLATGQKDQPHRFWQDGGGYDRSMSSPQVLRAGVEYIHANPVRRGLVERPEEWEWSSCREWLEIGDGPLAIDRDHFPLLPS